MSTINDMMQAAVENGAPVAPIEVPAAEKSAPVAQGLKLDFSFLKVKTGIGGLDERLNHPLNWNRSRAMARIIRGLEGYCDDLRLAVIDILIGLLELRAKKRDETGEVKVENVPVYAGGVAQVEYRVPES